MLTVTYTGQEQLDVLFSRVEKATDPQWIMDAAGAMLLNRIRTRFLDQRSPEGIKWKPSLAAMRRKAAGVGGGTLYDTGALFHSIQLYRRSAEVQAISTDVPYAEEHQKGIGQETRVFLGFSISDINVLHKFVRTKIEGALQ